ncbi:MAG: helix-turn-helix domain-containing protein [Candidatus Onthovivens sp.]|nr:helix-turn-helix domain-containing protein [Candidatus Onthovivens sp.]
MTDTIKTYISIDETFLNFDLLKKFFYLIIKKDVQLTKIQSGLLKVEEMSYDDYSSIKLSIMTIKNDLNLSHFSLIEVPFYSNNFSSILKNKLSGSFDLFEILLRDFSLGNKHLDFINSVFKEVPDYVINTVDVYLKCDSSIEKSSKLLFTHRNTVNYRVNKFINLTSINIKNCSNIALCRFMISIYNLEKKGVTV